MKTDDLILWAEVPQACEVSRQRVAQLRARPGFPEPVTQTAIGHHPLYSLRAVRKWNQKRLSTAP